MKCILCGKNKPTPEGRFFKRKCPKGITITRYVCPSCIKSIKEKEQ